MGRAQIEAIPVFQPRGPFGLMGDRGNHIMSNLANFTTKKLAPAALTQNVLTQNSVRDPRLAFESAIALLQPSRSPSQTPIGWRNRTTTAADPTTEKRAVADAARALAQLWNVAPSRIR
jgi:hypothetical protein